MLKWFASNLSTIVILAVILFIVILDIVYLIKSKKKGKNLCGCNCSGCSMKNQCHSRK